MVSIRSFVITLMMVVAAAAASFGQFRLSITIAPPALPVYEQPLCPGDGYIWTPGYWYWDDDADDYYWVPGTWVLAPEPGLLWTPGWWGWGGAAFLFHEGYWGPSVGFYGGVVYGFGYFGDGYDGGRWENGHFFYNRTVNNVNVTEIHNVYNTTVVHETNTRVSYNGGSGGIEARPTPEQQSAERERHVPPVAAQTQHVQAARSNPQLRASANQGRPPIAATARPGDFKGGVAAREAGAPYHASANRAERAPANAGERSNPNARAEENGARPATAGHVKDLPPMQRPAAPNTGNTKLDAKYQKQQEKLSQQQDQERMKLQQKQEQDHQRMAKQQANEAKNQQMEQKHQQQTQQLQQRHSAQQQQLQQRQAPPRANESRPKGK
jgi:hypothetical protein